MQVRIGIARQRVSLSALGRWHQASLGDQRDDIEVDPPQRRCESHGEHRRENHGRGQVDLRTDADRDDRLAQGEDDDEIVPFGEVRGHQPPMFDAREDRWSHAIEQDRYHPQRCLCGTVDERRGHEQADHGRNAERIADHPTAKAGCVGGWR